MAEDPLCSHQPGSVSAEAISFSGGAVYGTAIVQDIEWDDDARERMKRVPRFVRGMVVRSVEQYCTREGISRVTVEHLDALRARMPSRRFFS